MKIQPHPSDLSRAGRAGQPLFSFVHSGSAFRLWILFALTLILLLAGTVLADSSGTCGEGCIWTLEGGTLTIRGSGPMVDYDNNSPAPWETSFSAVVIEDGITSIGRRAFFNCTDHLTSVTIPSSVTSIGNAAFASCSKLESVTIPSRVTSIGADAFLGCSSLKSITIPSSVTSIDRSAFNGCMPLHSFL